MRDRHLTPDILQHLLARDGQEDNWLLLHHLAVCPSCYRVGGEILDLFESRALGADFCSLDIDLARSRAEAPRLFATLERHEYKVQRGLVRDLPRFQSVGFAEHLAAESLKQATQNPLRSVELAELAVLISSLLEDAQPLEEDWLDELRAYAWGILGNARRVLGELRSAKEAFHTSDEFWEAAESAGNALGYGATLFALKASLRLTQGRLEESLALLDQAIAADEKHALTGSLLVNKARIKDELGESSEAVRILESAARSIDPETSPELFFWARENLLDVLSKAGRLGEAEALLPEVQALGRAHESEIDLLRLSWVEARLAAGRGESGAALRLKEVRAGFCARQMGYDAALVSLELVLVLLKEERFAEVKAEAREIVPIFAAEDIHREALAALVGYRHAMLTGGLTLELATRISDYLRRARQNPTLRFASEIQDVSK